MSSATNTKNNIALDLIFSKFNPMKNLIIFILMLGFVHSINAQQDETIFKHYYLNHVLVNPAAAGITDLHELRLNARNQFVGFPGAPQTYAVGYNGPVGRTFGLGVNILTENIASLSRFRIQGSYAFRYQTDKMKLNIGFSTEFHEMSVPTSISDSPFFESGDISLADAVDGLMLFDATLGG